MISINQVSILFGGIYLFNKISFQINDNDRIGLVGRNGAGKSTILKIITKQLEPSEGSISFPSDINLGYLPQELKLFDGKTVIEETLSAFSEIQSLKSQITKINHELESRTDYESEDYLNLITKLTESSDRFQLLGGDTIRADIELALLGLGFTHSDFSRQTSEFSGGWRMRIELCKILLQRPDIILLDEPTNHLDIESIQWLEDFLSSHKGGVVLISHDVTFLDNVTNRTIEITGKKVFDYKANYSKYVILQKERRQQLQATYENQQKKIEETEKFINRFRYQATKSNQVQSRIKQLEKMDVVEIDKAETAAMHIKFPPSPRAGTIVVETKALGKSYDDLEVLKGVDLIIERGEKIAFVGKNGEGKSTLSKIIIEELDYTGTLKFGHNTKIGYYAQDQTNTLDLNKTVFETIDDIATGEIRKKVRDILGSFLFSGEDIDKKVNVLSGGEKARLSLAKLLLEPVNLLVLDEPTNHLDMISKDILKEALAYYDGTLILVSHDRYFLDGLVETIYEFQNKNIKQYKCGIFEFLKSKKLESLKDLEKKAKLNKQNTENASDNKKLYQERKEKDREQRKIKTRISRTEERIEKLESEIEKLEILLSNPDTEKETDYQDIFADYREYKKELEKEMEIWETDTELLE